MRLRWTRNDAKQLKFDFIGNVRKVSKGRKFCQRFLYFIKTKLLLSGLAIAVHIQNLTLEQFFFFVLHLVFERTFGPNPAEIFVCLSFFILRNATFEQKHCFLCLNSVFVDLNSQHAISLGIRYYLTLHQKSLGTPDLQ